MNKKVRWESIGSGVMDGDTPPTIDLDSGETLVFDSWASFRELAMTMRGVLMARFGVDAQGRIRKRRPRNKIIC